MQILDQIESLSGQALRGALERPPRSVQCPVKKQMRMTLSSMAGHLARGEFDDVLNHQAIWVCTGCRNCQDLLGEDVDFSAVIDALRQVALQRGDVDRDEARFCEAFRDDVRRRGRLAEWPVLGPALRQTAGGLMAAALFFKGKVKLWSPGVQGWQPGVKEDKETRRHGDKET